MKKDRDEQVNIARQFIDAYAETTITDNILANFIKDVPDVVDFEDDDDKITHENFNAPEVRSIALYTKALGEYPARIVGRFNRDKKKQDRWRFTLV